MQKTLTEHARSPARDTACATCHMRRRGRASHELGASRDAALLAGALDVRTSQRDGSVVLSLGSKGVGHAFPTGDLLRRLVVRVTTSRGTTEHPLGRTFGARRSAGGEAVRFELGDGRLSPNARLELPLAPSTSSSSSWEVVYQRVTGIEQRPPFVATIEDEILLARGTE
jgi:hypothetical protein